MERLREAAVKARDAGLAPIQCPEIAEALKDSAYDVSILICEVWDVKADKYHEKGQSEEYRKAHPFRPPGPRYGGY